MQRALVDAVAVALAAGSALGCDPYNVGDECCNIFGKDCSCPCPCWNAGAA